jgi:hypothetical protein
LSTTGQLSSQGSHEDTLVRNDRGLRAWRRLNLIDWVIVAIVLAGLAGIIYWLRW